jgi:glycosyltransferase involved in cell wall biosynthesis
MRIALNGTFWNQPATGSGQYLRALLPALARAEPADEFTLVLPYAAGGSSPGFVPSTLVVSRPPALGRINANLGKVWFEQIGFADACRRAGVALAHIPYFASPLFPPTRTVVTIHDLIPLILPAYRGSLLVRTYARLVAASARRADAVIADSECSKRDIVRRLGIDPARVHVVYLAADSVFRPIADSAAVRQKYNLPDKYLLYLGGYDQRKNVRVLIQAFARLRDLYTAGWRLVLAGVPLGRDSKFFPSPERIARDARLETPMPEPAIQSIGWVDEADKPALYSAAAAFLFPSLYEGFGLPPLEALACGTPVICSNASSLPEVVGDAAFLVDPGDASAWANAIRRVLSDDSGRAGMRKRGLMQSQKFSWNRAARETSAVYRSITA